MKDQKKIGPDKLDLLEICGIEMFRKIQRKKLEADEKRDNENLINQTK